MYAIIGRMGSGKSYRVVYEILDHTKKSEYDLIWHNVGGLRDFKNVKSVSFSDIFEKKIPLLYDYYHEIDRTDNELIEEFKRIFNVTTSRIIFYCDEAHRYFGDLEKSKRDKIKWFVTYHRHLFLEIVAITQSSTLINKDFHKLINETYYAYPKSKQVNPFKLRYSYHVGFPETDRNFIEVDTIPKQKKIFNLYVSGDKVRAKSPIFKFLGYFLLLFLVVLYLSKYIIKGGSNSSKNVEPTVSKLAVAPVPIETLETPQNIETLEKKSQNTIELSLLLDPFYTFVSIDFFHNTFTIDNTNLVDYPLVSLVDVKQILKMKVLSKIDKQFDIERSSCLIDRSMLKAFYQEKKEKEILDKTKQDISSNI